MSDSPATQRALEAAAVIARSAGLGVERLTLDPAAGAVGPTGTLGFGDGGRLGRLTDLPARVRRLQCAAVVMPADLVLGQDPELLLKLLAGLSCPLVVVR